MNRYNLPDPMPLRVVAGHVKNALLLGFGVGVVVGGLAGWLVVTLVK